MLNRLVPALRGKFECSNRSAVREIFRRDHGGSLPCVLDAQGSVPLSPRGCCEETMNRARDHPDNARIVKLDPATRRAILAAISRGEKRVRIRGIEYRLVQVEPKPLPPAPLWLRLLSLLLPAP